MAVHQAQLAVAAKVRARYGGFMGKDDYAALSASTGLPSLLSALREREDFARVLSESGIPVREDSSDLLIKYHYYDDLSSLFRFDRFLGSDLYRIPAEYLAVDILLSFARHFNAGTLDRMAVAVPPFFRDRLSFDPDALPAVETWGDLLALFAHHPYLPALAENLPVAGSPVNLDRLAFSLLSRYYERMFALFDQSPRRYAECKEIFSILVDLENWQRLLRTKQFFPDAAVSLFAHGHESPKKWQALQDATRAQAEDAVRASRYGDFLRADLPIDLALRQALYDHCRKIIRFRVEAPSLLIAYMILARARMACLITVVQGVRYGMAPDAITALLPLT